MNFLPLIHPYAHTSIHLFAHMPTPPPAATLQPRSAATKPLHMHPPHRSRIGATALSSEKRLSCNLIRQEAMEVHRTGQHFLNERARKWPRARRGRTSGVRHESAFPDAQLRRDGCKIPDCAYPIRSHTSRNRSHLRRSSACTPATRPLPAALRFEGRGRVAQRIRGSPSNAVRVRSSGRTPIRERPSPQRPPNSLRAAAALRHRCLQPRRTRTRAPAARC